MFTGLVQGLGKVEEIKSSSGQIRLRIAPALELKNLSSGESVAVNGVCLTVETPLVSSFTAYASKETTQLTNLGNLSRGSLVNLERALCLGDRMGGHIVSGHVDCLAEVLSVSPAGESTIFSLAFPKEWAPFVVPKGSIALDGVSLTINECGTDNLSVNIIPATIKETTLAFWSMGRKVNMETDIIGKHVVQALKAYLGKIDKSQPEELTEEFLKKYGFN